MVTKEDIKNLASLARVGVSPEEVESLTSEIDSILGYVGQIKEISADGVVFGPVLRNVMCQDIVRHKPGEYTEDILSLAPSLERGYIKVKKILE